MNTWTFYDFLDSRGMNQIRPWLDSIPERAAAKIDARIIYMSSLRIWPEAFVSALTGYRDIFELRIAAHGSQYRPLCYYGPTRRDVTILLGATEKGKLPRRVLDNAEKNRSVVEADNSRIEPHVFRKGSNT